jgi:hypothetical protein
MSTDQCLNDLRKAREFIERGWCKYKRAIDDGGEYTHPFGSSAIRWCALGAVDAALGRYVEMDDCPVRDLAKHVPFQYRDSWDPRTSVADFNNSTDREAVLALFDKAIADHMVGLGFAAFRAATLTALQETPRG